MKITLNKSIQLHSATVYMRIKKNVERADIQEYLNGKRFDNTLINQRINKYLTEIRVYDEENQLTSLGRQVKETGILPTPEEGKYKIWYTQNDTYFGNTIMYFRRESPYADVKITELNLIFKKEDHFRMPSSESAKNSERKDIEYAKFVLLSTELKGQEFNNVEDVTVKLLLEEGKQSRLFFSGTLAKEGAIKLDSDKGIPVPEKIDTILSESLSDYSLKNKMLRIRFNPNIIKDLYVNFEDFNVPCKWRSFSGTIDCVKLMPYDEEDAKQWRDYLLRDELTKHYYSPQDFEQKAVEINDKAGLVSYIDSLDIPKAKEFATRTPIEHWHIKAPMDLNPNCLFTDISEIITLQKDEKHSFAEIVSRLGTGVQNDIVVYYDKYVVDERKQKAAAALMDAIDASKKIIITDMSPHNQKSDFISSNRKDLRLRDLKSGIFARGPLHNRYLIVVSPNSTKFWDIGNSLDFIRFQANDVTPNTQGKIVQPVTFTPIPVLDKELLNFINKEKNGK